MKLLVVMLLATACATARPQATGSCTVPDLPAASQTKEEDIRKFLILVGAEKMGLQVMDQMLVSLRPTLSGLPPGVADKFIAELKKEVKASDLADLVVPIYAARFSQEEILQLRAMFASPIGRKYIEEQPVIVKGSMEVGREWGHKIALRAISRVPEMQGK
jgi:uncharacterized protein